MAQIVLFGYPLSHQQIMIFRDELVAFVTPTMIESGG